MQNNKIIDPDIEDCNSYFRGNEGKNYCKDTECRLEGRSHVGRDRAELWIWTVWQGIIMDSRACLEIVERQVFLRQARHQGSLLKCSMA